MQPHSVPALSLLYLRVSTVQNTSAQAALAADILCRWSRGHTVNTDAYDKYPGLSCLSE
jgi:hypothetical protein